MPATQGYYSDGSDGSKHRLDIARYYDPDTDPSDILRNGHCNDICADWSQFSATFMFTLIGTLLMLYVFGHQPPVDDDQRPHQRHTGNLYVIGNPTLVQQQPSVMYAPDVRRGRIGPPIRRSVALEPATTGPEAPTTKERTTFVQELSSADYDAAIDDHTHIVVVQFWAQGCRACKAMGPKVERLAEEYQDLVRVYKFESCEENSEKGIALNVKVIPTFFIYWDGKKVEEISGMNSQKLRLALKRRVDIVRLLNKIHDEHK